MQILSFDFILLCTILIVFFDFVKNNKLRQLILLAGNIIFIASFSNSFLQLLPIIVLLIIGYIALEIIIKCHLNNKVFAFILIFFISIFLYLKQYPLFTGLPPLTFPYVSLGLSYMFFKLVQLFVDSYQKGIKQSIKVIDYLNFLLFFPSYSSGPITRWEEFFVYLDSPLILTKQEVIQSFSRIATGCILVAFVSTQLYAIFEFLETHRITDSFIFLPLSELPQSITVTPAELLPYPVLKYAIQASIYTLYLFFNFSGYMHIAIGLGMLLGFRLPENFNHPFQSKNLLEFWGRWHMSLSNWFKFYLFNPILKNLIIHNHSHKYPDLLFECMALFITFLTMGIWHGTTSMFILYGIILGCGVIIVKIYQFQLKKLIGNDNYKELRSNQIYQLLGQSLTFTYFTIAIICIWADKTELINIINELKLLGLLAVFVLINMGAFVIFGISVLFEMIIQNKYFGFFSKHESIGMYFKMILALCFIQVFANSHSEILYSKY